MDINAIQSEIARYLELGQPIQTEVVGNERHFERAIGKLLDQAKSPSEVEKLILLSKNLKLFQFKNNVKESSRVA